MVTIFAKYLDNHAFYQNFVTHKCRSNFPEMFEGKHDNVYHDTKRRLAVEKAIFCEITFGNKFCKYFRSR